MAFHNETVEAVLSKLNTDSAKGLTAKEVEARKE